MDNIKDRINGYISDCGFDTSTLDEADYQYFAKPSYEQYLLFNNAKLKRADRVPTYLEENFEAAVKRCAENADIFSKCAFAFTTDYHTRDNSMSEIPMLRYLGKNNVINKVFCGGDFAYAFGSKELLLVDIALSMDAVKVINKAVPFYITRGNHDFTIKFSREPDAGGYTMPYEKACEIIMSNQPNDIIAEKDCIYYYTDDSENKIRYIVLDTLTKVQSGEDTPWGTSYGFDDAQKDWLINNALNINEDGWTVIVFGHVPCVKELPSYSDRLDTLAEVLKDFKNKRKGKHADFTNAKAEFSAYICGHSHKDRAVVEDNTLFISTASSAYYSDDGVMRIIGDESEVLFDVFFVNTKDKKLKTVRFGCGNDREFDY